MKRRRGRPASFDNRAQMSVAVEANHLRLLRKLAKQRGVTLSRYVNEQVVEPHVKLWGGKVT